MRLPETAICGVIFFFFLVADEANAASRCIGLAGVVAWKLVKTLGILKIVEEKRGIL